MLVPFYTVIDLICNLHDYLIYLDEVLEQIMWF